MKTIFLTIFALSLLYPPLSVLLSIFFLAYLILVRQTQTPSISVHPNVYIAIASGPIYVVFLAIISAWYGTHFWFKNGAIQEYLPIFIVAAIAFLLKKRNIRIDYHDLSIVSASTLHIAFGFIILLKILLSVYNTGVVSDLANITGLNEGLRAELSSRNPLMLASISLGFSYLCLLSLDRTSSMANKIFLLTGFIEGLLISLYFTESRGALLTFLIILPVYGILHKIKLKNVLLPFVLILLTVAIAYFTFDEFRLKSQTIVSRIQAIQQSLETDAKPLDSSIHQRFQMYQFSVKAISEKPILGHGLEKRFDAIEPFMNADEKFKHKHVHNTFLDHLIVGGVVGLVLFLLHIFSSALTLMPSDRSQQRFLTFLGPLLICGIGLTTATHGHYVHTQFFALLLVMPLFTRTSSLVHPK